MKRKRQNTTNLCTKEKSKEQETNYNESMFKRRRQELFEIISKENAINQPQKRQGINVLDVTYGVNYASSETEDLNDEDENNFRAVKFKERQKVIEECKIISRNRTKSAVSMLEQGSKETLTKEKKRLNMLEKHCSKNISHIQWQEEHEHSWDSSMYIIKTIRACILTRNWNNVTYLLLMLLKYKQRYVSYVKQVALLNLMNNPLDYNDEIFEELHKLCGFTHS